MFSTNINNSYDMMWHGVNPLLYDGVEYMRLDRRTNKKPYKKLRASYILQLSFITPEGPDPLYEQSPECGLFARMMQHSCPMDNR